MIGDAPEHLLNRFKRLALFTAPKIALDQHRPRIVRQLYGLGPLGEWRERRFCFFSMLGLDVRFTHLQHDNLTSAFLIGGLLK